MKIRLSMFVLPYEIDKYEGVAKQLKINSTLLENLEVEMDVTLSVSSELMNWDKSILPKEYFAEKFINITQYFDWASPTSVFDVSEDNWLLGCVSKRRQSWKDMSIDTDALTMLDCDIVFPVHALYYIEQCMFQLKDTVNWVLTPEIIRIWDNTWDDLVNDKYKNMDHSFYKMADTYDIVNDPHLIDQFGKLRTISPVKFAGGWLTTISKNLLDLTEIPEELGHYGLEDTYIMECANHMQKLDMHSVTQYVMQGLIVCENYRYSDIQYLTNMLSPIDRRKEFLQVANSNFANSVQKFIRRTTNGP